MSRITFNVAARCDKAGRAQNQDNFWVCPDLAHPFSTVGIGNDTDVQLSSKGALLVVADGMGGMSSGELASEYVIEGLKRKFRDVPDEVIASEASILKFITQAITDADKEIKSYAKAHHESEGMGSTIALAWLLGDKAYCVWCGDSRIYCYNPQNSLVRLSHDHSYVQNLVDEGKIHPTEAFDHPDSNIITRSIGDNGESANPETHVYPLHRRDVLLLCSDGLCGLLDDKRIETILSEHCTSSQDALQALWAEGEAAGWTDNATIEVACITESPVTPTRKPEGYPAPTPVIAVDPAKPKGNTAAPAQQPHNKPFVTDKQLSVWERYKPLFILVIFLAIAAGAIVWFLNPEPEQMEVLDENANYSESEYVEHVDRLYIDSERINELLSGINERQSISSEENERLRNFLTNANILSRIPEGITITSETLAKINRINAVRDNVVAFIKAFGTSREPNKAERQQPSQRQPVRTQPANPTNQPNILNNIDEEKPTTGNPGNTGTPEGNMSDDGKPQPQTRPLPTIPPTPGTPTPGTPTPGTPTPGTPTTPTTPTIPTDDIV